MAEHPNMDAAALKSVPGAIAHPIVVMQSKTVQNSITLFGEAYAANGDPVMVAIHLDPSKQIGQVEAFGLISSAYDRSVKNAQNLLDTSKILYVDPDKNRTDTWTKQLGLPLPPHVTSYGSIHSISASDPKSNIKFSLKPSMEESSGDTKYSIKRTSTETARHCWLAFRQMCRWTEIL